MAPYVTHMHASYLLETYELADAMAMVPIINLHACALALCSMPVENVVKIPMQ